MLLLRALGKLASLQLAAGKVSGWVYRKVWGRAPLHWFDHRFDVLRGPEFWTWQERGVLGMQVIPVGAKVLDLCCGEGFYDRMYFAERAIRVDALDVDGSAIVLAKELNRRRTSLLQSRCGTRRISRFRVRHDLVFLRATTDEQNPARHFTAESPRGFESWRDLFRFVSLVPENPSVAHRGSSRP
jgi:hypothetical protein